MTLTSPTIAVAATTGRCVGTSGPTCYFWTGKVTFVADGDTIRVDIYGDGTATSKTIRFTGINAMELHTYSAYPARRRGECHSLQATARVEALIKAGGGVVRLSAQNPASESGGRLRRSVAVKLGGVWTDLGNVLTKEGHVLFHSDMVEYAWNRTYNYNSQVAGAKRLNLWDRDACGSGPSQSTPLKMWVNWDADGTDGKALNGEWVRIKNTGTSALALGGWWFRDSMLRRYTFASGASIPAGGIVTVYMGNGTNTATKYFWKQTSSVFDNAAPDGRNAGDGGYLFDPQGDLRAWMTYSCLYACTDPLSGKIDVAAQASGTEYVDIRNTSTSAVNLEGYLLDNAPYIYNFTSSHRLAAGERLRIYVGSGTGSRLTLYWGKTTDILNNDGDSVKVKTYRNGTIDCYAWGTSRC